MRRSVSTMACDACRVRKIKCDSRAPVCGNCQLYGTACKYEAPRRRRGPKPIAQKPSEVPPSGNDTLATSPAAHGASFNDAVTIQAPLDGHVTPESEARHSNHVVSSHSPESVHTRSITAGLTGSFTGTGSQHASTCRQSILGVESVALQTHRNFSTAIRKYGQPQDLAGKWIDKFVMYRFPFCPAVHIESLYSAIPLLTPSRQHPTSPSTTSVNGGEDDSEFTLEEMRSYTLLTALCAVMCTLAEPHPVTPYDASDLAKIFLSASRNMLSCYEDFDIEHPNSSSLLLRYFQSNTLHFFGKIRAAMHLLRSAWSLAITLRLYDETSLTGVEDVEAQRLRRMFWCMYQGDKSASVLNGVPSMIMDLCLEQPITLAIEGPSQVALLHGESSFQFEEKTMAAFHMSTHLWRSGTDILLDMKMIAHARARAPQIEAGTPVPRANAIMHAYLSFCALLDDLPPWLANPDSYSASDEAVALQQRRSFWAQKTNLIITYHCLRLAIIRQAEKHGLCHLFGLTNDGSMLAMRRLKISNDMLLAVKSVPFESLQANGEPGAEKLRQAGVELLGIAHQTDDQVLAARANALFSQLLDVITSLNSKVSEELAGILAS
ncbi:Maltose fermentation regulatory protein MAL13 like [Verticillium longisporum]|nr:Maltose fermentation regulatory protein MAL13 like [Verticillium longisporum]CRK11456.1 hypothetical protein BN1708_010168 [Verticillium longisporum]